VCDKTLTKGEACKPLNHYPIKRGRSNNSSVSGGRKTGAPTVGRVRSKGGKLVLSAATGAEARLPGAKYICGLGLAKCGEGKGVTCLF